MSVGATTALLPDRPTPDAIFEVLRREQPTFFFGVPTLYAMMLADPACTPENGSKRLRWCVSAAEALPEHVGTEWKKRFGVDIFDGLGSTEMLHIFLSNQPGKLRYGTSGIAGARLRGAAGRRARPRMLPTASSANCWCAARRAAEGYWNQREKSRRTFEGEWTRTGDIYVRDAGRHVPLLRPQRRHVQGVRPVGLAVRGRVRADLASVRARSRGGAKEDDDGLLRPKAFVAQGWREAATSPCARR